MVDCSRFLEGYSAFRDGELEDDVRAEFEAHRAECERCARYDRVISEGVRLYLRCPRIEPSDDFLPRLQHRIYHLEDEKRIRRGTASGASAALTFAIAASIAAVAWLPAARPKPPVLELPPIAARAPLPPPQSAPAWFSESAYLPRSAPALDPWAVRPAVIGTGDVFSPYGAVLGRSATLQPVSHW